MSPQTARKAATPSEQLIAVLHLNLGELGEVGERAALMAIRERDNYLMLVQHFEDVKLYKCYVQVAL